MPFSLDDDVQRSWINHPVLEFELRTLYLKGLTILFKRVWKFNYHLFMLNVFITMHFYLINSYSTLQFLRLLFELSFCRIIEVHFLDINKLIQNVFLLLEKTKNKVYIFSGIFIISRICFYFQACEGYYSIFKLKKQFFIQKSCWWVVFVSFRATCATHLVVKSIILSCL